MRVKLKDPKKVSLNQALTGMTVCLLAFLAGLVLLGRLSGGWNTLLQTVSGVLGDFRHDAPLAFWLCMFAAGLFVCGYSVGLWEWRVRAREEKAHPPFTSLRFGPAGVTLEKKDARANVFFPYAETDLALSVRTAILRGSKGRRIRAITGITLSFTQENKTISVTHTGAMPFICRMLDEGKKFRRLLSSVTAAREGVGATAEERELAAFVQEQIQNYLRYGLTLRYDPKVRGEALGLSIGMLAAGCIVGGTYGYWVFRAPVWRVAGVWSLVPFCLFMGVAALGLRGFYWYWKDKKLERRLKELQGARQ